MVALAPRAQTTPEVPHHTCDNQQDLGLHAIGIRGIDVVVLLRVLDVVVGANQRVCLIQQQDVHPPWLMGLHVQPPLDYVVELCAAVMCDEEELQHNCGSVHAI